MKKAKQKLLFKPTPISRLRKRSKRPFPMVGYPMATTWERYWQLNYEFMLKQNRAYVRQKEIEREYGPFVEDYGKGEYFAA